LREIENSCHLLGIMNANAFAQSTSPSQKQQAADIIRAMEQCLHENHAGGRNPAALQSMQDLVWNLRYVDGPFGEKLGSLVHWSEIFWSPRRHTRWDLPGVSGIDLIRRNLLQDLRNLRSLNHQMKD